MIDQLVSDLPEVYQPIFGHPELSGQASRSCTDRLEHIAQAHDALQRLLGRRLKVLDLGCAQGYFSLSLAEHGAIVHGIDFLDKNIAVSNALTLENPSLQVSFETGRVEDIIAALEPRNYDLVLGLSIFHHIVHELDVDAVKAMLEHLAAQSGVLVVELALHDEPLYWAPAQPEDPRALLDGIAFVHEVARHHTPIARIPRPLFVASNRYWIIENQAVSFDYWSFEPHASAQGTHDGSRRYYYGSDSILKLYRFDHPRGVHNKAEFERELRFLKEPPVNFPAPRLLLFRERESDACLAMQRFPGRLLLERLQESIPVDSCAILLDVLAQLSVLEAAGLYHNDVRTWNVLVAENGETHLIDYGSISSEAQDCGWPGNLFLSFLIFIFEVVAGISDDPNPTRPIAVSPYALPQPYRAWAETWWCRPVAEWSFTYMHRTLLENVSEESKRLPKRAHEVWMRAMEEALQAQKSFATHLRDEVHANRSQIQKMLVMVSESHNRELALCHNVCNTLREKCEAVEIRLQESEHKQHELQAKVDQLNGHAHHWWLQANAVEAEREALRRSWSWRVTTPLRWGLDLAICIGRLLRRMVNHFVHVMIATFQGPLATMMRLVLRRPKLSYRINKCLMRYPALHQQLLYVAHSNRAIPSTHPVVAPALLSRNDKNSDLRDLAPRVRTIYNDLKAEIKRRQKP